MTPSSIFSKTGKGMLEASGKTRALSRSDRAVLAQVDGKSSVADLNKKFEKLGAAEFEKLMQQLATGGFIREVSAGAAPAAVPPAQRPAAPPPAPSTPLDAPSDLDFTQALKIPTSAPAPAAPKPAVDLAAVARAEAARKAEGGANDFAARQEAEAKAKAAAMARAKAEAEAKAKAEAAAKAAADAKVRAEAEARAAALREQLARQRAEAEAKAKAEAEAKAKAEAEAKAKAEAEAKAAPTAAQAATSATDALLADLDSFSDREDEERRQKEAENKARLEAEARAKREAEEKARRAAEDKARREAEEKAKREEEARLAREAEAQRAREEEDKRKRAAQARDAQARAQATKPAAQTSSQPAGKSTAKPGAKDADDDIVVSDDELDLDDIEAERKKLAKPGRTPERDRIEAKARAAREAQAEVYVAPSMTASRPARKWGKPLAITFFVLLLAGFGLLHVMPLSTAEFEKAASEALGVPVKIGSARLSLITGVELKLERITVGEGVRVVEVRAQPHIGTLLSEKKSFKQISLVGLSGPTGDLGSALFGALKGESLRAARMTAAGVRLDGGLPLLDVDAQLGADGVLKSVKLASAEARLTGQLTPAGESMAFEISAGSIQPPFAPSLTLTDFSMKGTATRSEIVVSEWDGKILDGSLAGTARVRWSKGWRIEGDLRARQINASVFAPSLMSEGKADARGSFVLGGPALDKPPVDSRLEGSYTVTRGMLGSFDIGRAVQSGGAQFTGRTQFTELSGVGIYNKGGVQLRDLKLSSGILSATGIADIDATGNFSGRVSAELKSPTAVLRGNLNLGGTRSDPQVKRQ